MPAYMIVRGHVTDRARFGDYSAIVPDLIRQFGGRYVALAPAAQVESLEGDPDPGSTVISEWPDMDAARRFWTSPEYAAAKKLREGCGTFHVCILPGMPDGAAG